MFHLVEACVLPLEHCLLRQRHNVQVHLRNVELSVARAAGHDFEHLEHVRYPMTTTFFCLLWYLHIIECNIFLRTSVLLMRHFWVFTFVKVRSNLEGSSQSGPSSSMDTTSDSLVFRSRKPELYFCKRGLTINVQLPPDRLSPGSWHWSSWRRRAWECPSWRCSPSSSRPHPAGPELGS